MADAPATPTASCEGNREHAVAAWATLQRVRAAAPPVHSVTNLVVTNLTANILLALGASPAMVENIEKAGELAAVAGAVVINVGSMSAARTEAMHAAAERAARAAAEPASFQVGLIDSLYGLTEPQVLAGVRIR